MAVKGNEPAISGLFVKCSTTVLPDHKEKLSLLTEPANNYSIKNFCSKGGGCFVNIGQNTILNLLWQWWDINPQADVY